MQRETACSATRTDARVVVHDLGAAQFDCAAAEAEHAARLAPVAAGQPQAGEGDVAGEGDESSRGGGDSRGDACGMRGAR